MSRKVVPDNASLTFADYFKMNAYVDEILRDFGYSFQAQKCDWPRGQVDSERLTRLQALLEENLPYLSLEAEIARREFLIGPVLLEANHYCHARIRSEYFLQVSDQLKGTIDYYLEGEAHLLVIEAKNADLTRGFTQLAVELVAVSRATDAGQPYVYGAVTVGDIWRFAALDRPARKVTQDLNLYRVPADLPELVGVLVGILGGRRVKGPTSTQ